MDVLHMEKYFDDVHAACEDELRGIRESVPDSPEVVAAKGFASNYEGAVALGKALSAQLRYHEAADAFSLALEYKPGELAALRLRAGRYLSSLQTEKAYADLNACLDLGADAVDIQYRLGLCGYFVGRYAEAMRHFEAAFEPANDEMKIAAVFWHTLSAYRAHKPAALLPRYCPGMNVGHHFAYEKAVAVWAGYVAVETALIELNRELEDLHYVIEAYGLGLYLESVERCEEAAQVMRELLARDGFWPCYAYIAAWNDAYGKENTDVQP